MTIPEDERGHDGLTHAERVVQMTQPVRGDLDHYWYSHQIAIVNKRNTELEARNRVLEEALREMMDFLRHAEWDSHSTEAHVGNLVEQARAALEAAPCTKQ